MGKPSPTRSTLGLLRGCLAIAVVLPFVVVAPVAEAPAKNSAAAAVSSGHLMPVKPARLLDTRTGAGGFNRAFNPLETRQFQVAGRGGVPSDGVGAVVLNVTVTQPQGMGYLVVYAADEAKPLTSNHNFYMWDTTPNLVMTRVSNEGHVAIENHSNGTAHIIADVTGWFSSGEGNAPGSFTPVHPTRELDTRISGENGAPLAAGERRVISWIGLEAGVPVNQVQAVVLNVTATRTSANGSLAVYGYEESEPSPSPPEAANLHFGSADTKPNLMIIGVGPGNKVAIYNRSAGRTDLIVDVLGFFWAGSSQSPGSFHATPPSTILDTKNGVGGPATPFDPLEIREVDLRGRGGVPNSGVGAVVLSVGVHQSPQQGYLAIYAAGELIPETSNLNFPRFYRRDTPNPNLVLTRVNSDGRFYIENHSLGATHVVADVVGWMTTNCPPRYGAFGPGNWPRACWRPYEDSSVFNTPLSDNPSKDPRSGEIIAALNSQARNKQIMNFTPTVDGHAGEPTYYSSSSDPSFRVHCVEDVFDRPDRMCPLEYSDSDPNRIPIRIPARAHREGGPNADPGKGTVDEPGGDRHLTVVDQATGFEYDLWQVKSRLFDPPAAYPFQCVPVEGILEGLPASGGDLCVSWGGRTRIDGDGLTDRTVNPEGDATAAHFASLAGRLRAEELLEGYIDHALTLSIPCESGGTPVWPAKGRGTICKQNAAAAPALGSRMWLDMSIAAISRLEVAPWKKVLLLAMKRYGMFVMETGSAFYFNIETEAGSQYTTYSQPDRWLQVAVANGWEHKYQGQIPDFPQEHYFGSFQDKSDGPAFSWNERVWANLRVVDPCVTRGTCQ
jgi:hypothetical protein